MRLNFDNTYSNTLLDMINTDLEHYLLDICQNSLNTTEEIWIHLIKKCID